MNATTQTAVWQPGRSTGSLRTLSGVAGGLASFELHMARLSARADRLLARIHARIAALDAEAAPAIPTM